MSFLLRLVVLGVAVVLASNAGAAAAVDVGAFVKKDRFETIKISPTGEYYAATVPFERPDRAGHPASIGQQDHSRRFSTGKNTHVSEFLVGQSRNAC